MHQGLGTQLRHLLDLLDGAVERSYAEAGLRYRPRYTPVVRALLDRGQCSVSEIAKAASITQPAATQTVALMAQDGLLEVRGADHDGRVRVVRLTRKAMRMVPRLRACWAATEAAARSLDAEMPGGLANVLAEAIHLLECRSFDERICDARVLATAAAE